MLILPLSGCHCMSLPESISALPPHHFAFPFPFPFPAVAFSPPPPAFHFLLPPCPELLFFKNYPRLFSFFFLQILWIVILFYLILFCDQFLKIFWRSPVAFLVWSGCFLISNKETILKHRFLKGRKEMFFFWKNTALVIFASFASVSAFFLSVFSCFVSDCGS